jgi:hypothetical protein
MTPEEIEYVREWAASGNEPRFAVDVEGVLPKELWKMLNRDEDSLCELSPVGITIAAQAERTRELEMTVGDLDAELDDVRHSLGELEAFRFAVAEKTGVMHLADGHAPQPGPDDAILESVASGLVALKKEAEFAHERHVLNERIRELESDFCVLFPWLYAKYSHEEGSAGE